MATIWEKAIWILAGNLNFGCYLILLQLYLCGGEFWLEDKTWTSLLLLEAEEEMAESSFELRAKNEGCFDLSLGGTGGGVVTSVSGFSGLIIWGFLATGSIQMFS